MAHEIGEETLHRISRMTSFNQWMFEVIEDSLGERVLEVGCGIGNLTKLIAQGRHVHVLDIESEYVEGVLGQQELLRALSLSGHVGDISEPLPESAHSFSPDTIVCLNVLEHVKDDRAALKNMAEVVCPGGVLIVLVPAFQALHGTLDVALGHYRRYNKKQLSQLGHQVGLTVDTLFYLNLFGLPGWWLNGKVLRRRILPRGMLDLYQLFVPLFKLTERLTGPPIGLSLVTVYRKP